MEEYEDFRDTVKKVNLSRVHKITNSIGTYDIYKIIRKNSWEGIGRPVSEKDFYTIIREVNKQIARMLVSGQEIKFPARMGTLELRKKPSRIEIIDGKLVTNLPIDWDATLKLWHEDKEAYDEKILVRYENEAIFKILYDKSTATYKNKSFYDFRPTRTIKKQISRLVKANKLDAYLLNRYD